MKKIKFVFPVGAASPTETVALFNGGIASRVAAREGGTYLQCLC